MPDVRQGAAAGGWPQRAGTVALRRIAAVALAGFLIRLLRLGELPITNDEAIYIRWAQLIASDWSRLFSLPLSDPKPPLHFALLALVTGIGSDPLVAGRVLSALFGSATIVAAALVAGEVATLMRANRMRVSLIAAVLTAVSPWLFFHQRLATADALFVFECTMVVWLALRAPRRVRDCIPFAIVLAAAVLTRQGISFVLLPISVAAAVTVGGRSRIRPILMASLISALLALPYLTARPDLYDGGAARELRRRLLYQPQFTAARADVVANARAILLPDRSAAGEPVTGWLWFYLTPPVAIASLAGAIVAARRRPAVLAWLVAWFALLVVPFVLFASVFYSRYALPAAVPVLVAAAIAFERAMASSRAAGVLLLMLSLIWPSRDLYRQIDDWQRTTLVERDAWQYLRGWPAGYATERAIRWLSDRAAAGPITVITTHYWGLPADAVWVYAPSRRWTIFYTPGGAPPAQRLIPNKWIESEPRAVDIQPPVYFVAAIANERELRQLIELSGPIEQPVEFLNPPGRYGQPAEASVVVARLR